MGQARRRERGLMHVFRMTAEEDVMDRMAEEQDAARFVAAMSTMAISFAGAALRDLVRPPFRIVYWRNPRQVRIVRIWKWEEYTDSGNDIR